MGKLLMRVAASIPISCGDHKLAGAECGARAQNQATKLFRFFREDDGYNETFAVAKW